MIDEGRPLFVQIAESVEDSIVDGSLGDDDRAPSTNELAAFYRINPATAAKGVNMLVDKGILVKRRGIGMFVAPGARAARVSPPVSMGPLAPIPVSPAPSSPARSSAWMTMSRSSMSV